MNKAKFLIIVFFLVTLKGWSQNTILDHKDKILIEKIHVVNSSARETNLSISPDGKYLYFMSDRGGQIWSGYSGTYKGAPRYDGDIWFAKKVGNEWQKPQCLGLAVNTSSGEDEPMISQDGQYVVFQSWKYNWQTTGGPYYQAEMVGTQFTNSKGIGGGINKFIMTQYIRSGNTYATDGASMSADGKTFLLCCGPKYDGNLDIYISRKENGVWSYMKRLSISTPGDERSVFIAGDGKTIYFASDGYKGYGGLDVYKTTLNADGTCGEVVNIGAPFNTSSDDYGFITTASGEESYFVRDGDIYYANTKEADPTLKPSVTVLISGTVRDEDGNPVQLYLELEDGIDASKISNSKSNSSTGEFLFSTSDVSGTYRIRDDNNKYIDTTFVIEIKEGTGEYHVDLIIKKEKPVVKQEFVKDIMLNFEHDRSNLDEKDQSQLDEIVEITKSSFTFEITIVGHTDANGSDEYNKKLGLERAAIMKDYLIKHGVDGSKIKISSEGESKLLEEEMHRAAAERNRRAELLIKYTK
jgi:outer membrane protein OmpA-like peptidoglycan-associated protein